MHPDAVSFRINTSNNSLTIAMQLVFMLRAIENSGMKLYYTHGTLSLCVADYAFENPALDNYTSEYGHRVGASGLIEAGFKVYDENDNVLAFI
jgi:hypothetical protein